MSERRLDTNSDQPAAHGLGPAAYRQAFDAALIELLVHRAGSRERLLAALAALGVVDSRQMALATAQRLGVAFTGLRGFTPDRRLFDVVPLATCRLHNVVPISLVDGVLRVAVSEPGPLLESLAERLPNLLVEPVLASADDIAAVLATADARRGAA